MELYGDKLLSIGTLAHAVNPPQLSATFFVKATFEMRHDHPPKAAKASELITGDVHYDGDDKKSIRYSSDFAVFKPRSDVLLVGNCHSLAGQPSARTPVSMRVGELSKTLNVTGNRYYKDLGSNVTDPVPFTRMPVSYENSFGGPRYKKNPVGKGHSAKEFTDSGHDRLPLPNIEYPPETKSNRSKEPAGFGPLNGRWSQRMQYVGTYGHNWEKTCWPWFPKDFDWSYFNAAPKDQQVDGYLRGDEKIELENLHPDHSIYRSHLPDLRARCFFREANPDEERPLREVPLLLDTLWIDIEKELLILVWRGLVEIHSLKMKEIGQVLVVTEPLHEPAKDIVFYHSELNRLITEKKTKDMPEDQAAEIAFNKSIDEMDQSFAEMENRLAETENEVAQIVAEADQRFEERRKEFITADFDPDLFKLGTEPDNTSGIFDEIIAELDGLELQIPEGTGQDPMADIESTKQDLVRAKEDWEQFDKEIANGRQEFDGKMFDRWTRERVEKAIQIDESFAEKNLAELDLSQLDLSGRNLSGARLNNANLNACNLRGAQLSKANLSGADLTGADLTGAVLDGADLSDAQLDNACLTEMSISHASLMDLNLAGADFSSCTGEHADFSRSNLTDASFRNVRLENSAFCAAKLGGAQFEGASMPDADFEAAIAPKINMQGANVRGLRGSDGADFTGGNFRGAQIDGANFDGSILDQADFAGSLLVGATFSDASAKGANFEAASLQNARFDDANLQQATLRNANLLRCSFERADLTEANLEGSNVFESGFWDVKTENTDFRGANLKGTMLG